MYLCSLNAHSHGPTCERAKPSGQGRKFTNMVKGIPESPHGPSTDNYRSVDFNPFEYRVYVRNECDKFTFCVF